ncbi:hypothetical protein ABN028_20130, partial [Actinopolymorpha sp. B17G11]|uniref:hypothetical protein n=1 Tax=Actinopolymorpha sp. B17G11 TaxID=3160861 RepID=UPI0032E4414C
DAAGFMDGDGRPLLRRRGVDTSPTPDVAEPRDFPARVEHWQAKMPEPGRFGRVQSSRPRFTTRLADLVAGVPPEVAEAERWELDRAADGGPGATANAHLAAVRGMGGAVDDEVRSRVRSMAPELGDYPRETVARARQVAADAEKAWRRADAEGSPDLAALNAAAYQARAEADRLSGDFADAMIQATRDVLGEIRDMGPDGENKLDLDGDPDAVAALRWAEQMLPTDWIGAARRPIEARVSNGNRGSYEEHTGRIVVVDAGGEHATSVGKYESTAIHELGHHLERAIPDLLEAQRAYYWARTSTGEVGSRTRDGRNAAASLADLFPGHGFTADELARLDWWLDPYMGRDYDGDHYEILSMGLQALFAGDWYLDDDIARFLMGLVASLRAQGRI